MNCIKCGAKLEENANFCRNCGEPTKNGHQNQYDYSYNYSYGHNDNGNNNLSHQDQYNYGYNYNYNNNTINSSDEDYMRAYVGKNYEKIKNTKFSIPTFFLGAYYLLYRKLWIIAIPWIIINLLTTFYIEEYGSLITLVLNIIICLNFSKIYLQQANKNVEKIKQQGIDKTNKELLETCQKKGGVSVAAPIITAVILFTIGFIFGFLTAFNEIVDTNSNIKDQEIITDSNVSELQFQIPDNFEKSSYNSDNHQYYNYSNNGNYCSIHIETNNYTTLYKTPEDFLNSRIYIKPTDEVTPITDQTINDTTWKFIQIKSSNSIEYEYATIYNNQIYRIEYSITGDTTQECSQKHNELINSLTFGKTSTSGSSV